MSDEVRYCSICQLPLGSPDARGNSKAWPVNEGRCCRYCEERVVIPARVHLVKRPNGNFKRTKLPWNLP